MDKNASTSVRNPLLQTASYGFPIDSLLSNNIIVPISKTESTLTETLEIDSFIGQEWSSQQSIASNLIVNESSKEKDIVQSVPLVVPPSSNSDATSQSKLPSTENLFTNNTESYTSQPFLVDTNSSELLNSNCSSSQNSTSISKPLDSTPFFNPASYPNPLTTFSNNTVAKGETSSVLGGPPATLKGSSNNYRLGNLKKPTYAPVPGLSSSVNVNTPKLTPFSPDFNQTTVPVLQDNGSQHSNFNSMSSFGSPSVTGPYNSTTENVPNSTSQHNITMDKTSMYRPSYHHWFYRKDSEKNAYSRDADLKSIWKPFSMSDSLALERAFSLPTCNENTFVPTDGGRYDVNILKRERIAVYWEERKSVVRRCSWFSKGPADGNFVPYEEDIAAKLEEEYKTGMITGIWNRKIELGNEEVIMLSPSVFIHQLKSLNMTIDLTSDSSVPSPLKPRTVKRGGYDNFDIDDGEPEKIDHLLFLVHGIGQFCDLKFRSIIEVVDEFRSISLQLTQSHFQESCELGEVNRIEILPVSWHKALHSEDTGIDKRLKNITLPSIPRMRDFSNDTILDILFYTSPVFCQVIINAVSSEMNRLHALFMKRNPDFSGKVSVGGHSLGSLIVFDLLSNQPTPKSPTPSESEITDDLAEEYDKRLTTMTRRISVVTIGKAGTGQPLIKYPRLNFNPRFFFAFGSPIACFIATRSNDILGEEFHFPTCKGFFNIFHPYDPIAYRIEPLIIPSMCNVKPVLISHHKGRKRMHLELKETVSHVGQKLVETVKNTWNMMYHLAVNKSVDAAESVIQRELNQVLQSSEALCQKSVNPNLIPGEPEKESTNLKVGCLNEGKRVDYVLQETPVEYFNEYLFALASHLCYWTSRDTMLMILKEIYGEMGVCTDNQLPQTILPFDITDNESSKDLKPLNVSSDQI